MESGFYKLNQEGQIVGPHQRVYGPGFQLDAEKDSSAEADGWKWFAAYAEAVAFFTADDIRSIFEKAVIVAKANILDLKEAAHKAQMVQGVDRNTATTNGVLLFVEDDAVFAAIGKYEQAGGHPIAAVPLLNLIKSQDLYWLKLPGVIEVFERYLGG